jgi:hypothetical protein
MIYLEQLVEISDGKLIDSDLGPAGSICYVRRNDGICSLIAAGERVVVLERIRLATRQAGKMDVDGSSSLMVLSRKRRHQQ